MTEIEIHQPSNTLAVSGEQSWWSERQLAGLRQIGVDRAGDGDLLVFMHVCQRTGLDPFARQIHMIERQGKWTIQTGIDGLRLVARRACDRTGGTLEYEDTQWCGGDGIWRDVWLSDTNPAAARVVVVRDGKRYPAVALWSEYRQTKRDGNLTSMWASRGAGQLAKCAEALALRKAFPQDLSGVYSHDEMARVDNPATTEPTGLAAALAPKDEPADDPITDETAASHSNPITPAQLKKLHVMLPKVGLTDRDTALAYYAHVTGTEVASSKDLTKTEAGLVLDDLERAEKGEASVLGEMRAEVVEGEVVE